MCTEKIRQKPPVFEFGGEVTLVRMALTRSEKVLNYVSSLITGSEDTKNGTKLCLFSYRLEIVHDVMIGYGDLNRGEDDGSKILGSQRKKWQGSQRRRKAGLDQQPDCWFGKEHFKGKKKYDLQLERV